MNGLNLRVGQIIEIGKASARYIVHDWMPHPLREGVMLVSLVSESPISCALDLIKAQIFYSDSSNLMCSFGVCDVEKQHSFLVEVDNSAREQSGSSKVYILDNFRPAYSWVYLGKEGRGLRIQRHTGSQLGGVEEVHARLGSIIENARKLFPLVTGTAAYADALGFGLIKNLVGIKSSGQQFKELVELIRQELPIFESEDRNLDGHSWIYSLNLDIKHLRRTLFPCLSAFPGFDHFFVSIFLNSGLKANERRSLVDLEALARETLRKIEGAEDLNPEFINFLMRTFSILTLDEFKPSRPNPTGFVFFNPDRSGLEFPVLLPD